LKKCDTGNLAAWRGGFPTLSGDPIGKSAVFPAGNPARALLIRPSVNDSAPRTSRAVVDAVIRRVRPFIVADGGDIELVAVDGETVCVRLTGACADCPSSRLTLQYGIEAALRADHPGVRVVRVA
jgi:Fe-S cluster biogenesis protein NfuA